MKDNLDWVHHDSKTVNENYYQVLEGTRSYGKTYGSINEINVNNIIIERNKAVKEIERLNNIINELEEYHIKSMKNLENTEDFKYVGTNHIKILYEEHKRTLDKLKELKGNVK